MNYGFCDLCINVPKNLQNLKELLNELYEAGYNTIVLNQNVDESVFESEKKKRKKGEGTTVTSLSLVPEPLDVEDLKKEFIGKLNIFNRITFSFSDPVKTHSMNQLPVLKKYHLYAVIPKTQAAFQFACSQLNVDIILINSSCSVKINRKLYLQAVDREIHFEIQYSSVIQSNSRKLAIHQSHLFYTFGKSKNVIITSGTDNPLYIRGPYDIINLARLLGLNEVKAKQSILQQAQHVLLKGEGRRYGKALFRIQNLIHKNISNDDSDDVPAKKLKT